VFVRLVEFDTEVVYFIRSDVQPHRHATRCMRGNAENARTENARLRSYAVEEMLAFSVAPLCDRQMQLAVTTRHITRLHDEAGSTSARRALVEPARRASFIV